MSIKEEDMKPKNNKILVDMDNTIGQLTRNFMNYAISLGWKLKPNIFGLYNLSDGVILPEGSDIKNPMKHVFCIPGFWYSIVPFPSAIDVIYGLSKFNNIWLVTTPYVPCLEMCKAEKMKWIEKYLPAFKDKVIFEDKKWELEGDIIIEDKPETLEKFNGYTIKVWFPYNEDVEADYTILDWRYFNINDL